MLIRGQGKISTQTQGDEEEVEVEDEGGEEGLLEILGATRTLVVTLRWSRKE